MASVTAAALDGVDVVVWVADATARDDDPDDEARERLRAVPAPAVLALNKVDLVVDKRRLLSRLERHAARYPFRALVPVSAATGDGTERLEAAVLDELRPGPAFYPASTVTDQPETFFVAERIREKVFLETRQEVPHASAVRVEELTEREPAGTLYVRATVFVEQPSQKAIIIGEGGRRLRGIGQAARRDLEAFFGVRVFLDLWVQVRRQWRRDDRALRELGYLLTS
jgi:GTP-binding protein Era